MGHIRYGKSVTRIATSDHGWEAAASQVGDFTNNRAARTDMTVVLGKDAGHGAPACFIPALAELHINTALVPMGLPDKVNVPDALWRLEHAAAVGAMSHEAAHARHTRFDPRDLMDNYGATRKEIDVITILEEPRCEGKLLYSLGSDAKPFLRACAAEIVGQDFVIGDTAYGASVAAGLLLARVDSGVFRPIDVRGFRADIRKVLGDDVLDVLEPLWQRFLLLHDTDYPGMVEVAREWLAALPEDERGDSDLAGESLMGEPLPGDGEGSGEGEGDDSDGEGDGEAKPGKGFGDRIKARARITESKADAEIVERRGSERAERRRKEREADAKRRAEGEGAHVKAFPSKHSSHGFSPDGFAHHTGDRPPTADERRAAKTLARLLERVQYRDRDVTRVTSVVPPGRLRGRVAVQAAAAASAGRDFLGEPWKAKRRKVVDSPTLTLGIIVDISGSMSAAMEPLASTQWVMSTAGAHIDARVATVHFGQEIHGIAPLGYREKAVRIFYPGDGSEAFKAGALAVDSELNLLDGRGARVLVVASDGQYVNARDKAYAQTFVPLAQRKGVAVIFLDFTGSMTAGGYGATVVDCTDLRPAEVATLVGKACVDELRRMDSRAA